MLTKADRNRIAVNKWTARIIPIVLAGVVGYATYVLVVLLCGESNRRHQTAMCCLLTSIAVNYLLVKHDDQGAAIPILVTYFLLFILMAVCFLRLVHMTIFEPPYVPLGAGALLERERYSRRGKDEPKGDGIVMGEYNTGNNYDGTPPRTTELNTDPDSPGLELFYTKDVFVSDTNGRPIWCSECCNWYAPPKFLLSGHCLVWSRCVYDSSRSGFNHSRLMLMLCYTRKPDRTHHDSSSGRCVRKMDHFCPWFAFQVLVWCTPTLTHLE